eukprot:797462-Pelagomonas_calceolata.AAC.1
MRRNEVRSSTTPARQLHGLNVQNCHIHLIEIKYCEDTRPGSQLEASQQQHSELRKQLQGVEIILHTILLGGSGTIILPIPWINLKNKGLTRKGLPSTKAPCPLCTIGQKLTSTRRAIETKNTHHNSGTLGLHVSRNPPNPC